jgi:hypothetical protein
MELLEIKYALLSALPDSEMKALDVGALERLCRHHPGIPADYLEVLTTVGHGRFNYGEFRIFPEPVSAVHIAGTAQLPQARHVLVVGDDWCFHFGYDTRHDPWRYVRSDHASNIGFLEEDSVPGFGAEIRDYHALVMAAHRRGDRRTGESPDEGDRIDWSLQEE